MKPIVKVFTTSNEATIVFKYPAAIPDCNGFAIFKRVKGKRGIGKAQPLNNFLGYKSQMAGHEHQFFPSTTSPIQRFVWADYSASAGEQVSYQVVPVLLRNNNPEQDLDNASDWTPFVTLGFDNNRKVYFNRGIVSSQFLAKRLQAINPHFDRDTLRTQLADPHSRVRAFLGGDIDKQLHRLLEEVLADPQLSIFAVLYELNEDQLEDQLMAIGDRVNLILCNGQKERKNDPATPYDERQPNAKAEFRLKTSPVRLFRRKLAAGAAHHKFMVICRNGVPERVWTGSTNWTTGGLYTQVNNALLVEDATLGQIYLQQWNVIKALVDAGDGTRSPDAYKTGNQTAHPAGDTTVWFAPTLPLPGEKFKYSDLEAVKALLQQAQSGVLYLMFSPSMKDKHSLYDAILDLHAHKPDLFIHGVLNSERPADKNNPEISFMNRSQLTPKNKVVTDFPDNIAQDFSNWIKELPGLNVKIHSKVIVIDPFSEHPVVVTGSHNLGIAASGGNDENMLIIRNDPALAHAYAVNILTVFDHFYWRYVASHDPTSVITKGLDESPDWMSVQLANPARLQELNFWLNLPAGAV